MEGGTVSRERVRRSMENRIRRVIVLGGGTAGWLVAATLAAEFDSGPEGIAVTLIESPDVATIGVGEGTWPSMRSTLLKIGISESDFIRECSASFKQGTRFTGWLHGKDDTYYHPFSLPEAYSDINLAEYWLPYRDRVRFADAVTPQVPVCEACKAPKQIATPEYACNLNYGYHLDAAQFSTLLKSHAIDRLGVEHVVDHVTGVSSHGNGDIATVNCRRSGALQADLFVDCSGFASLLLGQHYAVSFIELSSVLFNDTALAVQVPYAVGDAPIASTTLATAGKAGWIWDIGLPTRRGTGYVYASDFIGEDEALAELGNYLATTGAPASIDQLAVRKIPINAGHRASFWHRNCVAIGNSAGFIEPLEASALVLVELSARMLAEHMPQNRQVMDRVSREYNERFLSRWRQVIGFLKLHYTLSQRADTAYWIENRSPDSIPDELEESLELWRHRAPWHRDETHVDEMFPSASYQYILYGMGFATELHPSRRRVFAQEEKTARDLFAGNSAKAAKLVSNLPTNRELIGLVHRGGFSKV